MCSSDLNGGTFDGYRTFAESRLTSWRRKQSAANPSRQVVSLLSGKITGNLLDSGADPVSDSQIVPVYRALLAKFPMKHIRVFWDRDQGNETQHQGRGLLARAR